MADAGVYRSPTRKKKKTPKWVKHYHIGTYITFTLNLLAVIVYLVYLGIVLSQQKLYINYSWLNKFHELNSYSLLSPFTAFPIVAVLTYHVKYKMHLKDGDFLGILGIVLLMAGISIYDGTKLIYLNYDIEGIITNETGTQEYEKEKLLEAFKFSIRPNQPFGFMDIINHMQMELKCCGIIDQDDWNEGAGVAGESTTVNADNSSTTNNSTTAETTTASTTTVFNSSTTATSADSWPWSCCVGCTSKDAEGCEEGCSNHYEQGCVTPLWEYLIVINRGVYICMFVLATAFLMSMFAYIFHWAAMQISTVSHFDLSDDHTKALRFESLDDFTVVKYTMKKSRSRSRKSGVTPGAESETMHRSRQSDEITLPVTQQQSTSLAPAPRVKRSSGKEASDNPNNTKPKAKEWSLY